MREVPPADALADERDLGLRLDRHLRLDLGRRRGRPRAGELGERRAAVAEDPRVAVLVGPDRPGEPHVGERPSRARPPRAGRPGTRGSARRGRGSTSPRRARPRGAGRRARASRRRRGRTRSAARSARTRSRRSRGRSTGRRARRPTRPAACACPSSASQRARCSSGVIAIDVITEREPSAPVEGAGSDRERIYSQCMRKFFIALALAGRVRADPSRRGHGAERGLPAVEDADHGRRRRHVLGGRPGHQASAGERPPTERRRSRTDRAVGYTTARVLKTRWATGPMPLRGAG